MKSRVAIVSFLAVLGLVIGLVSPVAHAAQAPPRISSISPASGPPGTTVTLTGSGFAPIPDCYVYVHGVDYQGLPLEGTYHWDTVTGDWNANRLVLRLDPRANPGTTMTISVTVYVDQPDRDSNLVSFKVEGNPTIDSVSPNPCASGGRLTIKGKNFGQTRPDDFDVQLWNDSNPSQKYHDSNFLFMPSGTIKTSALPKFEGTYHVVVSRGVSGPPSSGGSASNEATVTFNPSMPVPPEDIVLPTSRTWAHDSIGVGAPAPEWYLTEGSTAGGDEMWVLLQNPNGAAASVTLTYVTATAIKNVSDSIPANSRKSFRASDAFPETQGVSVKVKSNQPVVAEKAVYGNHRTWGHDSVGVSAPATQWYLAEGCTGPGFESRIGVMNPGSTVAKVTLTYMTASGPVAGPSETIPAMSRRSYNVGDKVKNTWEVSTKVTSDKPVVAERAMFGNSGQWAHDSIGVSSLQKDWYLAEGCTAAGFETWVLVQNPNDKAAKVSLTYMTSRGAVTGPSVTIAARSRKTFEVARTVSNEYNVSTKVTSDLPVVAERSMYGNNRTWAHDSVGVSAPGKTWYLAEGCTLREIETWVLVQNPNAARAAIFITYMTPSGPKEGPSVYVSANSRMTFNVADAVNLCSDVSTKVTSDSNVVVERAMYGDPK